MLQDEVRKADAEGYKRGIDEMISKQQGGEVEQTDVELSVNPFLPTEDGPPKLSQSELMLAAQAKEISESGVPSTVGRVDGKSGMILLPLGSERGVSLGNVYTLWKENKKAARYPHPKRQPGVLSCVLTTTVWVTPRPTSRRQCTCSTRDRRNPLRISYENYPIIIFYLPCIIHDWLLHCIT